MTHGHHAAHVVVNSTGEDGTEDDPQVDDGAEQRAVQSTKDGAQTCDVQQLDQEQLPLGHNNEVNTVVDADSGGLTVVRTEDLVYMLAIEDVAQDEDRDTDDEG